MDKLLTGIGSQSYCDNCLLHQTEWHLEENIEVMKCKTCFFKMQMQLVMHVCTFYFWLIFSTITFKQKLLLNISLVCLWIARSKRCWP